MGTTQTNPGRYLTRCNNIPPTAEEASGESVAGESVGSVLGILLTGEGVVVSLEPLGVLVAGIVAEDSAVGGRLGGAVGSPSVSGLVIFGQESTMGGHPNGPQPLAQ